MATLNRRHFLLSAAACAALPALPQPRRIRLGIVGTAGQGQYNWSNMVQEDIVALCDVDTNRAAEAQRRFPNARFYQDFRRMLQQRDIEAVVVSTPDHLHAPVAVAAMRAVKHVYCEKPLAHSVHEVRVMMETAARMGVVTQMGTQIHAGDNYRRVVELIQAGAIGPVRRVHVWCNARPRPGYRAHAETEPPRGLDYDLWLGPAPYRPYHSSHAHFVWRWWWDFGGGVLADMACHYMDLPHWALNLRTPTRVRSTGQVTYVGDNKMPDRCQVDYDYPARGDSPPVHLTWYHSVAGPDLSGTARYPGYSSGVLFVGERGELLANYTNHRLLPEERFRDYRRPEPSIPRSVGHHREWLDAIRSGGTTTCNFAYSGSLALTVLLGNVAYRSGNGRVIEWDNARGEVTNTRNAAQYLQREYRRGWSL
jgi:predicted dehydrogenase